MRSASASAGWRAGVVALVSLLLAACGGAADVAPGASGTPSPGPAISGGPIALASPVAGQLVKLESEGLTRVRGFSLRTDDGAELEFRLGILENGAEFPPGHLGEHMALGAPIRVFFRLEGNERVVYRLEDAE